jgi:hypothetical protein
LFDRDGKFSAYFGKNAASDGIRLSFLDFDIRPFAVS